MNTEKPRQLKTFITHANYDRLKAAAKAEEVPMWKVIERLIEANLAEAKHE